MIGGRFKVASVASVAAAGLFMGGVAAQAADLGGNCCADLEERVAELEATTVRKGNRKVSVTLYGQVNKAIVWHNDDLGTRSGRISIGDNFASQTRFGFKGSAKVNADVSIGFRFEMGFDDSLDDNLAGPTSTNRSLNNVRQSNVYIQSKSMGKLTLGRGSLAADGVDLIDLGGIPQTFSGLTSFYSAALQGSTFSGLGDIGGNAGAIRYDTPTIGGFVLSASWANLDASPKVGGDTADAWDVALRYAGEFGAIRVAAGVAYRVTNSATDVETTDIAGSASVMHTPTGLFVSAGGRDVDPDASANGYQAYHVEVGIAQKFTSLGKTRIWAGYAESDYDAGATLFDATSYTFGISQDIDAAAAQVYLHYKNLDNNNAAQDDVDLVTAGMIVKF